MSVIQIALRWLPPIGYGAIININNHLGALIIAILALFPASSARSEPITIAILGDSLVQGYGLVPEMGFVPQLTQWLAENGDDARLLNAGVSGDTSAGGLARLNWTIAGDIDALVVSLGGNDALRGIDPAQTRANLDAILDGSTKRGLPVLLVGISAPGNFGPDFADAFNNIYPDLAQKYATLLYPNFLAALSDRPDHAETLSAYFQADALHPNAAGVALIVNEIGPLIAELAAIATP